MHSLIALCVRRYGAVTALALMALALGVWRASSAPLDVFPEFVPAQVDIQTEAPGFTPLQVESLVTKRIESAVNGSAGLATLRSESIPGLSVVTVIFTDSSDVHVARQGISERLSELGAALPAGVGSPRLSPLVSSTMDLLKIGLLSDRLDPFALRDAAEWLMKPRLLAVPGVAHVVIFGGSVRQIQIAADPHKLRAYAITLAQVADSARSALALRGAGFIDLQTQRVLLTLPTPTPDLEALALAVVTMRDGVPIHLADLATIQQAPALRSGDSLVMGKPGVILALASQYGANTLTTTRAVEHVLAELRPALIAQGIKITADLHRPANFIERALADLERALIIAAVLIIAVLLLFLRDWRAALIAFAALPLSLLAAVAVLGCMGQTLNTMTLGGLAVALGVLVDDAIIDLENILRRLRTQSGSESRRTRLSIITSASLEVRGPVVYATLVVIGVFVPELFASNVQGRFVAPLALAFILAVLASLLVAMTVTPALCALLLRTDQPPADARWLVKSKQMQLRAIDFTVRRLNWIITALSLGVAAALLALPYLGGIFMPEFREGHFVLQVSSSAAGTSLDEMMRLGAHISADVLKLPYVQSIAQQIGRAELGEDTWGSHQSEFHVELKPDAAIDQGTVQLQLREILRAYPGVQSEVVTFLGDRISESLSGETAQVSVKVFGDDLDQLDRVAGRIAHRLQHVAGIVDLQFKQQSETPTLSIRTLPRQLAAFGLTNQQVYDTVQTAYAGTVVGQTFANVRTVDAVLILPLAARQRPEELSRLMVDGPSGPVALGQLAEITLSVQRYRIEHDGGQRRVAVTFNVDGRDLQAVVDDARRQLADLALPTGFFVEFAGAAQAARTTQRELVLYTTGAVAGIFLALFVAFRWRANAWLVLANLPFSLIGGVAAIAISGVGISLGSVVGLVTVFGISARNAILQLAHYEHLVGMEGGSWDGALVLRGANERFIPILMTAAVTALALAPLALSAWQPGQEIEGPMAITVLGGLLSSTVLNLLVLPALAQRFSRPPHVSPEPA